MYIDNFIHHLHWQITLLRMAQASQELSGKIENSSLELKNIILQNGEAAFYQHDSIAIVKYKIKRDSASGQPKVV